MDAPDFTQQHVARVTNSIPSTFENINTLRRSVCVLDSASVLPHVRLEPTDGVLKFLLAKFNVTSITGPERPLMSSRVQ